MVTGVFNKAVFAPACFFAADDVIRVTYTQHARRAAQEDRYGDLTRHLRNYIDMQFVEVVEVEVRRGEIVKRVIRVPIDDDLDLVMVITSDFTVKTVWGNRATDKHSTLRAAQFVTEELFRRLTQG